MTTVNPDVPQTDNMQNLDQKSADSFNAAAPQDSKKAEKGENNASFLQIVGTCMVYAGMGAASLYGLMFLAKISPLLGAAGLVGLGVALFKSGKKDKTPKPPKKLKLKDMPGN